MIISLSCGLTAIGYFKGYFNKDHEFRTVMNEAIYPFYLLDQPTLIFVGYFVLQCKMAYTLQAILIIAIYLIAIIITYWFIIREFNILRISFGLKLKQKDVTSKIVNLESAIAFDK